MAQELQVGLPQFPSPGTIGPLSDEKNASLHFGSPASGVQYSLSGQRYLSCTLLWQYATEMRACDGVGVLWQNYRVRCGREFGGIRKGKLR